MAMLSAALIRENRYPIFPPHQSMRSLLAIVAILLAIPAGMSVYPHSPINGVLAGAVVYLLLAVIALRRRIERLEQQRNAEQQETVLPRVMPSPRDAGEAARESPEAPAGPVQAQPRAIPAPPPFPGETPVPPPSWPRTQAAVLLDPLLRFLTGGNPVLKIGIVVLFFGVGFLLKYAAQRNLIPIELRLAGVTLGGLMLLALGWRLRRTHPAYGCGLEGGGIGILYLVVFAAAKLYHLLPLPLALAVMIGLVGLSCGLAILQQSKGLALFGSAGGFLAPVLMTTGSGSHVLLFSYYALLNSGILAIAWFKAWRELNLLGFGFTFGIATLWGASAYSPAHFATTEPFLILFFLMYCLIAVLFAHRQPLQLRGFIDGPLVFGLPVVASTLQAALVRDMRFGMALSALVLGSWYIGLAWVLWRRMAQRMRLLTEAYLALGVVFASLAIPLGLDPHWTTAAWAAEGAAMIWVGVRQNRPSARIFGLILQAGAVLAFLGDPGLPSSHSLLLGNRAFLGCALIAVAALGSAYWLDLGREQIRPWEQRLPAILLVWGLSWWYVGGYRDLERHLTGSLLPAAVLFHGCATTVGLGLLARRLAWQRLPASLLVLAPLIALALAMHTLGWHHGPLLAGPGWLAWPLAFAVHYAVLARFETTLPARVLPAWHSLGLWLVLAAIALEAAWRIDRVGWLSEAWSQACWAAIPTLLLYLLEFHGDRLAWPVRKFTATYHGLATDVPLLGLLVWTVASFTVAGDPAPLPYIPVGNPLELIELAILLLASLRMVRHTPAEGIRTGQTALLAVLTFLWLNVVTGRTVHFFTGVAYDGAALFASPILQAALAALWSMLALSLTILGARKGQRRIWLAGAGLLALTVVKLFAIDLTGTGTIGRIVSFLVVGLLMLIIGYFAPLPPPSKELSR